MSTTSRNIRVPDHLWVAAQAVAKSEDTNVSELVRRLLENVTDSHATHLDEVG